MALSRLPLVVRVALLSVIAVAVAAAVVTSFVYVRGTTPLTTISATDANRFTPHRALYRLDLQSVKHGSSINNVGGKMLFAWTDACDAWTIEQRLDLSFQYEGGTAQRIKTSLATWESKDSSQFRFNVRRETDGNLSEAFRGRAQLARDGSGGQADYQEPAQKVELQPRTLFPSTHTLELLQAARAGQHMLTRTVFDGADEKGRNQVSAFIGDPVEVTAPEGVKDPALQTGRMWPVRMAFFAPDNVTGTPDYEMTMHLLENGVASALTIDYGDFIVKATLDTIEPLTKPTC